MSIYLGDFAASATVRRTFATAGAGGPATLSGTPAAAVYKDGNTTQTTTGVTLTADFDSVTGLNQVVVDLSADTSFYAAGSDFAVVLTAGTVDGVSVVGEVLAEFSIAKRTVSAATASAIATAVYEASTATVFAAGKFGKLFQDLATNQTTLLNRLGAWTGTGVNTVLGAFKALLSKAASVPSDIGGTFDPAADSTEAIAEAVAAGGGGGSGAGANTVTVTVTDGTDPLQNATVTLTEGVSRYSNTTDASGDATFSLDDATYGVAITKAGYTFTPTTHEVDSGDAPTLAPEFEMTQLVITPSADPDRTVAFGTVYHSDGSVAAGEDILLQLVGTESEDGGAVFRRDVITATTDGSGLLSVELLRSATYRYGRARVVAGTFTTGAGPTWEIDPRLFLPLESA